MQNFPPAVLLACASNISKISLENGCSTKQIIRSANPTGDCPEQSCSKFNFIAIGKKTLGLSLTDFERAFLAATGFTGNMNSSGFEHYFNSPEADWWPDLRKLFAIAAPQHLQVFDKANRITGVDFSTDRQIRIAQLDAGGESVLEELDKLGASYYEQVYPSEAEIEKFMDSEDVIVISDKDFQMANTLLATLSINNKRQ